MSSAAHYLFFIVYFLPWCPSSATNLASLSINYEEDDQEEIRDPRIVGGNPLKKDEYITHQLHKSYAGNLDCGATLAEVYAVQIALTATHCVWTGYPNPDSVDDPAKVTLTAGDKVLSKHDPGEQIRNVTKIVSYPGYDPTYVWHDISIMFLGERFFETKYVEPVTLPEPNWKLPDTVFVSGWGSKEFGGEAQDDLQFVDLPVVSTENCARFNKSTPWNEIDTKYQFCAGEVTGKNVKGSCTGDSGGGAIGWNDTTKEHYLAGIVSFGTTLVCGNPFWPTVYTKMTSYVDWVRIEVSKYIQEHGR